MFGLGTRKKFIYKYITYKIHLSFNSNQMHLSQFEAAMLCIPEDQKINLISIKL